MGNNSKIQWTEATWNPWHGCKKVSPGCKYCYMYRDKQKYGQDPTIVTRSKTKFDDPLTWTDPKLIFTCSWSDFFIEEADPWRDEAWEIIRSTPHHTYQILTKRPDRIVDYSPIDLFKGRIKNVWLGTSIESEDQVMRATYFPLFVSLGIPTFWSIEPLIGRINIRLYLEVTSNLPSWVIVGGESGNDKGDYLYRPCKLAWLEEIVNTCKEFGVPVFVKQLGTHLAKELNLKDRHGGDINEWPKHLQIRQTPYGKQNLEDN